MPDTQIDDTAGEAAANPEQGLYLVLISMHGLIRGHQLELGRDADTGGQIKYVVELARALAEHPDVGRVDLLTRQVFDSKVDADYAEPQEKIADNAYIIRLPCGPRRYLRKEVLWPHLDSFVDEALQHVRRVGQVPDLVHAHYADAGYVGARLAAQLGVPLAFTGHSLGRVKRLRLRERGAKDETIESQYNIGQRIEAEELALDSAALVVVSTHQEIEEQYALYDNYQPKRMNVIPPGIDLSRFHPPRRLQPAPPIKAALDRFLTEPGKPMVLALSRADERKNIATLVRAYAENPRLRELANLVIVAGNRDDIQSMDKGTREVLTNLLLLIDRYDLYGSVAIPKHHAPNDVPDLYRAAAKSRGVFVNPALTEPFGLTLIEAAASGLPMVATEDGGPRDIVKHCKNGVLIDPLDADRMGDAILGALGDRAQWRRWAQSGIQGAQQHYSWRGHVNGYLKHVRKLLGKQKRRRVIGIPKSRLPTIDRLILCDVDNTLLGDRAGLHALLDRLGQAGTNVGFGVATGRNLKSTLKVLKDWGVPMPDVLLTSVGSEIYYGQQMVHDPDWPRHTDYRWRREAIVKALADFPGLELQPEDEQQAHKISYYVDPEEAPNEREIVRHLRQHDLHANVVYSHLAYIDILPIRVSKGLALRFVAMKWGLPLERVLVAGDSGNDGEMLYGETLGVVVGNHSPELDKLRGKPRIYFAGGDYAWGILEGIEHYDFLNAVRIPEEEIAA